MSSNTPQSNARHCLRCRTPMELGEIPDTAYLDRHKQMWFGPMESGRGFIAWAFGTNRRKFYVHALRCPTCGTIELVATEPA